MHEEDKLLQGSDYSEGKAERDSVVHEVIRNGFSEWAIATLILGGNMEPMM